MKFDRSMEIYEKALNLIPMGTSTFSKNPNLFVIGASPLYIQSAKGCVLYDVDGNELIDYSMALGPIILGYANAEVNKAAKKGIDEGLVYTVSSPEESMLAERLIDIIPCAEMVRFCKNGSDVCEGAIRLARNYTQKLKIMTVGGYHGFHDWFIVSTPRNKGIPKVMAEWILPHNYNDIDAIEKTINAQGDEIAALIMEPVINYEPKTGYLERIRELTEKNNIVLIYDEMKTGFRLHIGGAQKYFNVVPDIAVFAKGLSNGFPLSVLAGKKYLMKQFEDENCFFSGSYATEKASLNAALKTIEILERDKVIEQNWKIGDILKRGIRKIINKHNLHEFMNIVGFAPMTHFVMVDYKGFTVNEIRSFIQQECIKRGVLFVGYHHICFAHRKKHIDRTLKVYDEVMSLLKQAIDDGSLRDKIEGKPISAFSVRSN
ncbi:MAG: aminotransferase class III-fold pyridoxal phosphate-dependent enzyme [Syntrophorhabdaceae bacterium]|nr:aminotransferase class III-fold pyridoxal phosphate-dependent enzyme [Syntrophorhabdaceae bacterium]MDD5242408.1 aminotransferase class III-fold pyridoxal phosphate-dependent enzyme [Syntrophorhabdaceae bacterium]